MSKSGAATRYRSGCLVSCTEESARGKVKDGVKDKIFAALKGVAKIEPKTVSQEEFDKLFK